MSFTKKIMAQKTVEIIRLHQKVVLSTKLVLIWVSKLSKYHPSYSVSSSPFHHLIPTKNLPETFLTNQKSTAKSQIMVIKTSTEFDKIMSRNRYAKQALNFKNIWVRHKKGWLAFVRLKPCSIFSLFIIIIKYIMDKKSRKNWKLDET